MFKSYTRKSSAMLGADRAGIDRKHVYVVDGVWGFDVNESADGVIKNKSADGVIKNDPVTFVIKASPRIDDLVKNTPVQSKRTRRRKTLRDIYRAMSETRKENRTNGSQYVVPNFVKTLRRMQRVNHTSCQVAL